MHFLVNVLEHALPTVNWNPEIKTALWTKLAINCAINPLTGLEQVKNGKLADQHFSETLNSIVLAHASNAGGKYCLFI